MKRLNPELEILTDRPVLGTVPSYPLVLRFGKRTKNFGVGKHYLDSAAQRFCEMKENGQNGEYLCGVSEYSPEYDRFQMLNGSPQILMRGWRSLVLHLVARKVCSLKRAKHIFSSSLGDYDHDKLTYEQKLKLFLEEVE